MAERVVSTCTGFHAEVTESIGGYTFQGEGNGSTQEEALANARSALASDPRYRQLSCGS
jgi:hypothetical protein